MDPGSLVMRRGGNSVEEVGVVDVVVDMMARMFAVVTISFDYFSLDHRGDTDVAARTDVDFI